MPVPSATRQLIKSIASSVLGTTTKTEMPLDQLGIFQGEVALIATRSMNKRFEDWKYQ